MELDGVVGWSWLVDQRGLGEILGDDVDSTRLGTWDTWGTWVRVPGPWRLTTKFPLSPPLSRLHTKYSQSPVSVKLVLKASTAWHAQARA
jgi:hypothetical protein